MDTSQKLQELQDQIIKAELSIKIIKNYLALEEIFMNHEKHTFRSLVNNDVKLFDEDGLWSCGQLQFSKRVHFLEMHKIVKDKPYVHTDIAKLRRIENFLKREFKKYKAFVYDLIYSTAYSY